MISKIVFEYVGPQINKKINHEIGTKEYFDVDDKRAYLTKTVDTSKLSIQPITKPYHIVSSSEINDVIISHLVSKLHDQYPSVGKFYGYCIKKGLLTTFKETHISNLREFLKSCQEPIRSLMILHLLLTIGAVFQSTIYNGYLINLDPDTISVNQTERDYIVYNINGKSYKLPTCGYIPVISKFSSSQIIKIGKKPVMIKNEKAPDLSKQAFDKSLDCFLLLCTNNYKQYTLMSTIKIVDEYRKLLKKKYNITDKLTYKPNSLSIEQFMLEEHITKFIQTIL